MYSPCSDVAWVTTNAAVSEVPVAGRLPEVAAVRGSRSPNPPVAAGHPSRLLRVLLGMFSSRAACHNTPTTKPHEPRRHDSSSTDIVQLRLSSPDALCSTNAAGRRCHCKHVIYGRPSLASDVTPAENGQRLPVAHGAPEGGANPRVGVWGQYALPGRG